MKRTRRTLTGMMVGLLLMGTAAPLAFTSCESTTTQPAINLTMESDYSGIIEAIRNGNKTLADQLGLIETAIKNGFKDSEEAIKLIEAAVKALQGTVEDKLAAIETAIESQTTSLETKLGLIEAAVKAGAADAEEQQQLISKAIEALQGSLEEKLAKIEEAVKGQTTSLETKLGLIETAVKEGLAGSEEEQKLIKEAIEALEGTVEDKLAKLEEAIKGQTTSLGTKLAAIEAAVKSGAADAAEQQELIKEAIEALGDALGDAMSSIKSAIGSQTTGLSTKLAAIETALKNGIVNEKNALDLIKTAVASISTTVGGMGTAMGPAVQSIIDAIDGISSSSSNEEIVKALNDIFDAIEGLTDFETLIPALLAAVEDAMKPIPNVEKQWIFRNAWNGEQYVDLIRDFGYSFNKKVMYWDSTMPEDESYNQLGDGPYSIKLLDNGWVKVYSEGADHFYMFSEVTETTAKMKLYYNWDLGDSGYILDEYGWGWKYWNNFEVNDPPRQLKFKDCAFRLNEAVLGQEGLYRLSFASNYPGDYDPEIAFYEDVLGGNNGSFPLVVINGYGLPEDYESIDVTDKVVMINRGGGLHFWEKLKNASEAGATAVICANNVDGIVGSNVSELPSDVNPIPFISVSKEFGKIFGLQAGGEFFASDYSNYDLIYFLYITDPNNYTAN